MKPLKKTKSEKFENEDIAVIRPPREKLTRDETLRRVKDFDKRKEAFIAAIRNGARGTVYPRPAE
jgi:hypothetical protein